MRKNKLYVIRNFKTSHLQGKKITDYVTSSSEVSYVEAWTRPSHLNKVNYNHQDNE